MPNICNAEQSHVKIIYFHGPGLAHWGSIRLVPSTVVDLNLIVVGSVGSVVARDVTFDPNDGSHLFVATESGILCIYHFFGPSKECIFFDHHLSNIFQSSSLMYNTNYILHVVDLCGQLSCTTSTPVILTCGYSSFIDRVSFILVQLVQRPTL